MTSILRSTRYLRCLNVFARRIIVNNDNRVLLKKNLQVQARCSNYYLTKNYATNPALRDAYEDTNLDKDFDLMNDRIQRFGRVLRRDVEELLDKVRRNGNIGTLDALLLIRACGNMYADTTPQMRIKIVNEIWDTLNTLKIPLDVSHFNSLLKIYVESGEEFSPIEFLSMMKDKNIEPNVITYQRLILYHCKCGNIVEATKILEFMREKSIPLNEAIFNALIIGHSESNDLESAKKVIDVMKDAGVQIGSSTYTALLCAYAKCGDISSIKNTLDECTTKNLYLQDNDYFEIIQTLAVNDHKDLIDEILSIMPKSSLYNTFSSLTILKILENGNVDVALKILKTMKKTQRSEEDSSMGNEKGTFLIKKMVYMKYPIETIIDTCNILQRNGDHVRPYEYAFMASLDNGDVEMSLKILESWKNNNGEIREHYFWPLMIIKGKSLDYQGIFDIVDIMIKPFNITISSETLSNYVIPFLSNKFEVLIEYLKEKNIDDVTIKNAIACKMINDRKINKTAIFMIRCPSFYDPELYYRRLAECVKVTKDVKSYAVILRLLCENSDSDCEKSDNDCEKSRNTMDIVDTALQALLTYKLYSMMIEEILTVMVKLGLSISPEMKDRIIQELDCKQNDNILQIIEKLASGTLTMMSRDEVSKFMGYSSHISYDKLMEDFQKQTPIQFYAMQQDLYMAIRSKDIKTVRSILKQVEMTPFKINEGIYAQLIELFSLAGDVEMAVKMMNKCKAEIPNVVLDASKEMGYIKVLMENDRFDDALEHMRTLPKMQNIKPDLKFRVKEVLNIVVATGDVEKTNILLNALMKTNIIAADSFILSSLIKAYLNRNDVSGAFNAVQEIYDKYKCIPMKNELSKIFINSEDADSLQKLTDLSSKIHGDSNSLLDLVKSFIQCERLRQARKILETPNLKVNGKQLRRLMDQNFSEDSNNFIDHFIEITKGLTIFDRQEFYDILLDIYIAKEDSVRALDLWTKIQDEDLQPSDNFLQNLASLLKKKNKPIPFNWDSSTEIQQDKKLETESTNIKTLPLKTTKNENIDEFMEAIDRGDLEIAAKLFNALPVNTTIQRNAVTNLIIAYIDQNNDVDKACELAENYITKYNRYPQIKSFKKMFLAMSEAKQYKQLKKFGDNLNSTMRQKTNIDKFITSAHINEFGFENYIDNLEKEMSEVKTTNLTQFQNQIVFFRFLEELKKNPGLANKFRSIVDKFDQVRIYTPANILWSYFMQTKNKAEADEIWHKSLIKSRYIIFDHIFKEAENNKDFEILNQLCDQIVIHPILSNHVKALVIKDVIEAYRKYGQEDNALQFIENISPSMISALRRYFPECVENFKTSVTTSSKSLPIDKNTTEDNQRSKNVRYFR